MVSFEIAGAGREGIFRFMNALQLVVRGTSLGDVHTLALYPMMSSHRDVAPRHRERMGIRDNLVRFSVGIEAVDDIVEDIDRALAAV
jgi:cystathionine gamma-synthase/methionine-gamma-lyase